MRWMSFPKMACISQEDTQCNLNKNLFMTHLPALYIYWPLVLSDRMQIRQSQMVQLIVFGFFNVVVESMTGTSL